MQKKKWYQGTPGAILFLILFFPVGLFLMWKYTSWPRVAKGIVSGFFAVVMIGAMVRQPESIQPPTQDTHSVGAQDQTKPPVQISDDVSEPPADPAPDPEQTPESEQTPSAEPAQTPEPEQTPSAEPAQTPEPEQTPSAEPAPEPEPSQAEAPASTVPPSSDSTGSSSSSSSSRTVYVTKSGKRYHYDSSCNGGTYYESTLDAAKNRGLTPCKKCT